MQLIYHSRLTHNYVEFEIEDYIPSLHMMEYPDTDAVSVRTV